MLKIASQAQRKETASQQGEAGCRACKDKRIEARIISRISNAVSMHAHPAIPIKRHSPAELLSTCALHG